MRKLLLAVVALFSWCVFLSGTEVMLRSANSNIESIVVEKDNLIIKSKGKTYSFKFSELLKEKTVNAQKSSPQNLEEAFATNGEWGFFHVVKSAINRLQYINNRNYKVFHDGDMLKRVLYQGKYYARDLNKNTYEPYWTMKKDFSPHFIPVKQYIESLDNEIKLLEKTVPELKQKLSKAEDTLKANKEKYIELLSENNNQTTTIDKNGNIVTEKSSGRYTSEINSQLRHYKKDINDKEKAIKSLMSDLA